jgi:hypothetical protein
MAYHDRAMCCCAPAQAALCVWVVRRAVQIACKTISLLSFSYVCPKPVLTKRLKRKKTGKETVSSPNHRSRNLRHATDRSQQNISLSELSVINLSLNGRMRQRFVFCGAHRSSGMIGSVRCKFKTSTWFCPTNEFCLDSLTYRIEGVKEEKKRKESDLTCHFRLSPSCIYT